MANHSILAVLNHDDTRRQIIASLNGSLLLKVTGTFYDAIEILRTTQTDLIISDICVSDDAGNFGSVFDFMRWVKGNPFTCSIPFVCVSGKLPASKYQADGLRIAARSLGAAKYLNLDNFDQSIFRQEIDSLLKENFGSMNKTRKLNTSNGEVGIVVES